MARTWCLPLIILTAISFAPVRAATAGMSDYGEAVTKIAFYERLPSYLNVIALSKGCSLTIGGRLWIFCSNG